MKLPAPAPGLVVRYSYLWARLASRGHVEGDKDRPAVIVLALIDTDGQQPRVMVLPITQAAPTDSVIGLQMPAEVAKGCGLDEAPHWVVLSEFNDFVWPGYDLRPIHGRDTDPVTYGFVQSGFFSAIRSRWLSLVREGRSLRVTRD